MESLVHDYGLFLLFLLIAMESAGIPLPGETALVTAGVLASRGDMDIVAVIAVAATAAIVGDNRGYRARPLGGGELPPAGGPPGAPPPPGVPLVGRVLPPPGPPADFPRALH